MAIEDVEGLNRMIAEQIVSKPGRLTKDELRFLRKALGLSQKSLGAIIGAAEQAVARWERGVSKVDEMADRFVRALYREHRHGKAGIRELVSRLNALDEVEHFRLRMRHDETWRVAG